MNNKKNIIITGANGFIGGLLFQKLKKIYNVVGLTRESNESFLKCDINNIDELLEVNKKVRPDVVIHAAGTKDIKFCENNKKKAYQINANLVENITKTFQDSLIIYISTDYVFAGDKGMFCENEEPNPKTIYGKTKLQGERIGLKNSSNNFKIIRTASIFSEKSQFISYIDKSVGLKKDVLAFKDAIISPTYIGQLICAINELIQKKYLQNIFHVCGGPVTRYEFAKLYSITRFGNFNYILEAETDSSHPFLYKNLSLDTQLTDSYIECNKIGLEDAFREVISGE
jgi:dTDP-4-dehydrorhamnose reductase